MPGATSRVTAVTIHRWLLWMTSGRKSATAAPTTLRKAVWYSMSCRRSRDEQTVLGYGMTSLMPMTGKPMSWPSKRTSRQRSGSIRPCGMAKPAETPATRKASCPLARPCRIISWTYFPLPVKSGF